MRNRDTTEPSVYSAWNCASPHPKTQTSAEELQDRIRRKQLDSISESQEISSKGSSRTHYFVASNDHPSGSTTSSNS